MQRCWSCQRQSLPYFSPERDVNFTDPSKQGPEWSSQGTHGYIGRAMPIELPAQEYHLTMPTAGSRLQVVVGRAAASAEVSLRTCGGWRLALEEDEARLDRRDSGIREGSGIRDSRGGQGLANQELAGRPCAFREIPKKSASSFGENDDRWRENGNCGQRPYAIGIEGVPRWWEAWGAQGAMADFFCTRVCPLCATRRGTACAPECECDFANTAITSNSSDGLRGQHVAAWLGITMECPCCRPFPAPANAEKARRASLMSRVSAHTFLSEQGVGGKAP